MANQTTRFGLNTFGGDVAGTILDDDGKFTGLDRDLIDLIFSAIEQHNHRFSAAAAAGPSDAPTTAIDAVGSLSAGLDYSYVVSFVSDDGLETPAGDEVTETTPDILSAPDAPSGETALGGGLATGSYDYALTGVRGAEQSPLGDLFSVTLITGEGTVNLTLPPLGDADSYTVWRRKDTEGGFTSIASTTSTSLVDIGAVSAYPFPTDPTYAPPTSNAGVDQYAITVTLSAADQALVQNYAAWRLYRTTTSGIYSAQSLVAEVVDREVELDPESDLLVVWTDFGDSLITGQPNTIDQRMDFEPFTFEESVSLAAASGDYPENYPLIVGNSLYISDGAGDWVQILGASGGSTGQVLTKLSSADGDMAWAYPQIIGTVSSSAQTRSTNTTKAAGLSLTSVQPGTYLVEVVAWLSVASSAPGLAWDLTFSGTLDQSALGHRLHAEDATIAITLGEAIAGAHTQTFAGATEIQVVISGLIRVTVAGDLTFRFAQQTSDAALTTLAAGSSMKLSRTA